MSATPPAPSAPVSPYYERALTVPIIVFADSPTAPHTGIAVVRVDGAALQPLAPGDTVSGGSIRLARARPHDDGDIMIPLCTAEMGEPLDATGRYPLVPILDGDTRTALAHAIAIDELTQADPEKHVLVAAQVEQARRTVTAVKGATHALFRVRFFRGGLRGIPAAAAPFLAQVAQLLE